MTSSSAIHVSAGDRRVAILHDVLRLTLRFRARLFELDNARSARMARAASGSQEQSGCSMERAR
jgi:hypothetical protein